MDLVRPESLQGLFGDKYKKLPTDVDRASFALPAVALLLPLWMSGGPLRELEAAFLPSGKKLGRCEYARHFVSRIVPDLAFIAGLPTRLLTARANAAEEPLVISTVLATLGGIVREGCNSPEATATRLNLGRKFSRVAARQHHDSILHLPEPGSLMEDLAGSSQCPNAADTAYTLTALS